MDDDLADYRCDRWRRPGHDRLYVSDVLTADAASRPYRVGFRDLLSGEDHATCPQDLMTLAAVADEWERRRPVPDPVRTSAVHLVRQTQQDFADAG